MSHLHCAGAHRGFQGVANIVRLAAANCCRTRRGSQVCLLLDSKWQEICLDWLCLSEDLILAQRLTINGKKERTRSMYICYIYILYIIYIIYIYIYIYYIYIYYIYIIYILYILYIYIIYIYIIYIYIILLYRKREREREMGQKRKEREREREGTRQWWHDLASALPAYTTLVVHPASVHL